MPKNPKGIIFIQKGKKPHKALGLVIDEPGRWGVASISKKFGWDIYDFKKAIKKLEGKGLVTTDKMKKLYPTSLGESVYNDTFLHRDRLDKKIG